MIYTVLLKKMLVQSVNKSTSANYTVAQFFVKIHYLKHWFSLKLAAPTLSAQSMTSVQAMQTQRAQQTKTGGEQGNNRGTASHSVLLHRADGAAERQRQGHQGRHASSLFLTHSVADGHHERHRRGQRLAQPLLPHHVRTVSGAHHFTSSCVGGVGAGTGPRDVRSVHSEVHSVLRRHSAEHAPRTAPADSLHHTHTGSAATITPFSSSSSRTS